MFKSIFNIVEDVTKIVVAPIEITVAVTEKATSTVADGVEEVVDQIKQDLK